MESLEELKQELKQQKTAIENKGGTVATAHTNPSPSEITTGINSIPVPNLAVATATSADVINGKTFYAGDSKLKYGSLFNNSNVDELMDLIFQTNTMGDEHSFYFEIPAGQSTVKPYLFNEFTRPLTVTLPNNLEEIGERAFYNCTNLTLNNFYEQTQLTKIGEYAFNECHILDLSILPSCIEVIDGFGLRSAEKECDKIVLPASLVTLDEGAFMTTIERNYDYLDLNGYSPKVLMNSVFQRALFDCDFVIPDTVERILQMFNYRGRFNHIIIPASVTEIQLHAFDVMSSDTVSKYVPEYIEFKGETPPELGYQVFNRYGADFGMIIYVPDNSVEAYKAVENMRWYTSIIKPVSEMST